MASPVPIPENNRITIESQSDIKEVVEPQLKHRYGRGIYTHDVSKTPSGDFVIQLGNVIPKDLSDCREEDNVVKFVPIDGIYQLQAERTNGQFVVHLPDRELIIDKFRERQEEIVDQIDLTMARTIYEDVAHFGEVNNQLAPIRQILHWTRTRSPIHTNKIQHNQRSDQTLGYLQVLEDLGYLYIDEDGMVHSGETLDSLDLSEVPAEDFTEVILGDVIQRGYEELRDKLGLRILSHYPMISGAYYLDAVQKEDPNLWLDLDTIVKNLFDQFGNPFKRLYIEEKLAQLSHVDVLDKDGDFVKSNPQVYDEVESNLGAFG